MRTLAGADAFVPPRLPPVLSLDTDLVGKLYSADRALGELAGMGRTLPSPHLFTRVLNESVSFAVSTRRPALLE